MLMRTTSIFTEFVLRVADREVCGQNHPRGTEGVQHGDLDWRRTAASAQPGRYLRISTDWTNVRPLQAARIGFGWVQILYQLSAEETNSESST